MMLKCGFVSYLFLVNGGEVYVVYLKVWKYEWHVKLKFLLIKGMESLN